MQALVLNGDFDISVQQRPDPSPGPGEVLIEVIATGICGSDFHGYSGENGRRHPGQVMGHETVGRIAELGPTTDGPGSGGFGSGAAAAGLAPGQLVTVNPVISCGRCAPCRDGQQAWCADKVVFGVTPQISAAFADRFVVPAGNVVRLPDDLPAELGALVEPLAVGHHAVRRGSCTAEDRVLVIGGGPIGQACALAVGRAGATAVAVSDPRASRRQVCERLGATVIDPTRASSGEHRPGAHGSADGSDLVGTVTDALGGRPTLVIDAVGVSDSLADALAVTALGGRIVLVGMGSPRLDLPAYAVSTEERTVIGSFTYTAEEFAETAAWVGRQPAGIAALIDGRVGWDGAAQAFDDLARGRTEASKILVFPQGVPD